MLYEVTFYCNQIACANLVESDAMWNGKEYFIQEVLQGMNRDLLVLVS